MSWKSFKFFDLEEVKDPDTNQPYDKLKVRWPKSNSTECLQQKSVLTLINARHLFLSFQEVKVTCCACGRGQMIFGDILFNSASIF